jgi:secretion/DNA translocation related TadE-like protein
MTMPFLGILLLVTAAMAFQGGVLVAQRRVQAAADLAALAGAAAAQRGEDACAAAAKVAERNAARLATCSVQGSAASEVLVAVARDGPRLFGRSVVVHASARGGPAPP